MKFASSFASPKSYLRPMPSTSLWSVESRPAAPRESGLVSGRAADVRPGWRPAPAVPIVQLPGLDALLVEAPSGARRSVELARGARLVGQVTLSSISAGPSGHTAWKLRVFTCSVIAPSTADGKRSSPAVSRRSACGRRGRSCGTARSSGSSLSRGAVRDGRISEGRAQEGFTDSGCRRRRRRMLSLPHRAVDGAVVDVT